jgi:vanillate O-demethylase monooxygenase subunit
MLIRNSWYVAAWSEEVTNRQPLARTVLGEALVLFRTKAGAVSVLEDRCAHRRMPLSLGKITEDDNLACPYHGLTFDKNGVCVLVPGQASTQGICVKAFPVEERWGCVWVWMGEPSLADPSRIFDCSHFERPNWHQTKLYRQIKGSYLLVSDNLSDLSHLAYLHAASGAGNEHMANAKTDLRVTDSGYHFVRETTDIPIPPGYVKLTNARGNVDRWFLVDFVAPSFYRIQVGAAETGTGGPKSKLPEGQGRWSFVAYHLLTPETEKTTHYFEVMTHQWPSSPEAAGLFNKVMDEDKWAIEHQQRNIDLKPQAPIRALPSDAPMFEMRKIVARLYQGESKGVAREVGTV